MAIIVFSQSISSLLQLSLIQSRSFGAKLGPSSCTWAVLPGDLPLPSHGRFTPACAARTVVFGLAGEAFGIICSYSVLPCVALEKLEWRWVWDTSDGTTAVGFRYSLAPLQSKLKSVERFAWRSIRVDQLPRAACWRDTRSRRGKPVSHWLLFWMSFKNGFSLISILLEVFFPLLKCHWFLCKREITQLKSVCMLISLYYINLNHRECIFNSATILCFSVLFWKPWSTSSQWK